MWVVIHMCMEATVGTSLYRYLQIPKMLCFSYYLLWFLFNKIGEQECRTGSAWQQGMIEDMGGEVAQTMHAHMNKCKNN
jgi:hypothetical protein